MKSIRPLAHGLLALAALLLAGCASQLSVPASPDILRIGVAPNSAPMISKSGGQYVGLEADLARALAAEMGREPRFVERRWDQLLPSLAAGQFDIIMSNMTITAERRIQADFTDPYLQVGQMLLVRGDDFAFFQDPRIIALTDKRIGVEAGTVSEAFVQRNCLQATRVTVKSPEAGVNALTSGKIDVFVHDAPVIWRLSSTSASRGVTMIPTPLGSEYLGWAVRRGDTATLKAANSALAKWRKSGRLTRMINRWVPTTRG